MQETTVCELAELITNLVRDARTDLDAGSLGAFETRMSAASDEYSRAPSVLRELAHNSGWASLRVALMELDEHTRTTAERTVPRHRVLRRAA
ncbi:MAG: hypothetical protein KGJ62_12300 [Armatimonadetes bacterium]|nr:hypothetical protein [Armatimonadota bacterium]MDE2206511.1 hypothetical protein [Armatimonadota bacterium]